MKQDYQPKNMRLPWEQLPRTLWSLKEDHYAKLLSQEYSLLVILENIMVTDVHKKGNNEQFE